MALVVTVGTADGNVSTYHNIENIRYINDDSYGIVGETERPGTLVVCQRNVATLVVREDEDA